MTFFVDGFKCHLKNKVCSISKRCEIVPEDACCSGARVLLKELNCLSVLLPAVCLNRVL